VVVVMEFLMVDLEASENAKNGICLVFSAAPLAQQAQIT